MMEHRSAVERYFLTNAMSFFVGWCYIQVLRDLVALTSVLLGEHGARWGFIGELVVVTVFGPALTLILVQSKTCLLRKYAKIADQGRGRSEPSQSGEAGGGEAAVFQETSGADAMKLGLDRVLGFGASSASTTSRRQGAGASVTESSETPRGATPLLPSSSNVRLRGTL